MSVSVSELEKDGYRVVGYSEGCSNKGTLGAAILVRDLTPLDDEDNYKINSTMRDLYEMLWESESRKDPERLARQTESRKQLVQTFGNAPIYVREIANGYWNSPSAEPWLQVTTPIGVIEIGWRKRVISIQWEDSDIAATAEELFPDENVTKTDRLVHAWGYEKAAEYIAVILSSK